MISWSPSWVVAGLFFGRDIAAALSDRGACLFEEGSLPDDVGLAALAPFWPDVIRVRVAPAIRAEIGLGLDERARVGDHVYNALIKRLCRDRLGEKLGHP